MTQAAGQKSSMGFWTCSALVVGNMVGSGVFLLPASLAAFGGLRDRKSTRLNSSH